MALSREEIYDKVRETLVEALSVDEGEVTPEAALQADLGAESIDFLDIVFRLEKTFGIQIPRGEMFPDSIVNNAEFVENGRFTSQGLAELKRRMPHASFNEFEKNPDINRIWDLFTVNTIVNYIQNKLNAA